MALSQKGAHYDHRDQIPDGPIKKALDDLASRTRAIADQGQYGLKGKINTPEAPFQLHINVSGGIFTATVSHPNPPLGVRYRLQWATTPNFLNPIEEEIAPNSSFAGATWQKSLPNQNLYFRVASKFLASGISPWVYYGSAANPILAK